MYTMRFGYSPRVMKSVQTGFARRRFSLLQTTPILCGILCSLPMVPIPAPQNPVAIILGCLKTFWELRS